jgi:hypothetical protein
MSRVPESPADDDAKRPTVGPDSSVADRQECNRRKQPRIEPSGIAQKPVTISVRENARINLTYVSSSLEDTSDI